MARQLARNTQLARRTDVRDQLLKIYDSISRGFEEQIERADSNLDYWDIYHCALTSKQFYTGNSKIFIPLVHNATEARKTRFLNTLFPQSGRYIEVTTEDGEIPHATMALLEQYVERAELKTKVVPALLTAGDVEGQYSVCVTWDSRTRQVVHRESRPIRIGGIEHPGLGEEEVLHAEEITEEGPEVYIVPDADLLILPVTAESGEDALDRGGSVTTICRWSKERVEKLLSDGDLDTELDAEELFQIKSAEENSTRNTPKKLAEQAGVKAGGKYLLVWRTWARIKIGKERRLVLIYFGGPEQILGCKLCPYWCDKHDIISAPVKKMPGVAKGMSLYKPCADMQYMANDFANIGADSATYSLLPVIMTDPVKNPRYASMVMDLMAIWEVDPKSTQPLNMPQIYTHSFELVQAAERYINQTLGVSAAAIPQSTGMKTKRNQAEIALEQQVDVLSTNVEVSGALETGILTPLLQRFAEYDAQYRDVETTVRSVGELGVKAEMMTVPPLQMGRRWKFRWFGVEAARTAQQIQQQIALINVLGNLAQHPSIAEAGYRMNLVPFVRTVTENGFGPRLAPEIFERISDKLALDPELENEMMAQRLRPMVSPMDHDAKHMQTHLAGMQQTTDAAALMEFSHHMADHQKSMQAKAVAQQVQQLGQAMQGGRAQGQQRGQPRQGAQPAMPKPSPLPAGRIHPDQMPKAGGVIQMPRRM